MRLQVSALKGVEVIVPSGINSNRILPFLLEHKDWIQKKRIQPHPAFLLFGSELDIIKIPSHERKSYIFSFREGTLSIKGPFKSNTNLNHLFEKWLFLEARDYLTARTYFLAGRSGFKFNRVTIKRQTSRWGSCSGKKNISLNFRLVKYSREIIDYVIYHELCHLIEMNHSVKFWRLVESHVPDYKEIRKKLKNQPE